METLLTATETAQRLGLSPRTLEGFRRRSCGPIYVKVSARRIRYSVADVERWVADCRRASTSATKPPLEEGVAAA